MRLPFLPALALACATAACLLPKPNGLAGKAEFKYACNGAADPYCDSFTAGVEPSSLPVAVARGASFGILYDGAPATPVSMRIVRATGARYFFAERAGTIGFLAGEANGEIVDAQRVDIVEPESLSIEPVDGSSFGAAGSVRYRAVAMAKGRPLPGALRVTWTVDDPTIAAVSTRSDGLASVTILGSGSTTLRASFDALGEAVTVGGGFGPPPRDPDDAGDADADAGDAGGDA